MFKLSALYNGGQGAGRRGGWVGGCVSVFLYMWGGTNSCETEDRDRCSSGWIGERERRDQSENSGGESAARMQQHYFHLFHFSTHFSALCSRVCVSCVCPSVFCFLSCQLSDEKIDTRLMSVNYEATTRRHLFHRTDTEKILLNSLTNTRNLGLKWPVVLLATCWLAALTYEHLDVARQLAETLFVPPQNHKLSLLHVFIFIYIYI